MSTYFQQARVGFGVKFFEENFLKTWSLKEYSDNASPAIFFGLYDQHDMRVMRDHIGPKIIIWGGADATPKNLTYVSSLQAFQEIYHFTYSGYWSDLLSSYNIKHKVCYIALKDYSSFKPVQLGDKIYLYKGLGGTDILKYKFNEIINPLMEEFGQDRIIHCNNLAINNLIDTVYEKCFVYIKPNPLGGCTTMFELGHMGIRTIGKGLKDLPCFTEYQDISDLINLIKKESEYIGQKRIDIANMTRNTFTGKEWLNLDYWRIDNA